MEKLKHFSREQEKILTSLKKGQELNIREDLKMVLEKYKNSNKH